MKKLISLTIASGLALALTGCGAQPSVESATKLDVKKVCDVNTHGVMGVLKTAKMYNPIAVKKEIEFMRFKVTNSKAIAAIEKDFKAGKKSVHLLKKKKYPVHSVKASAQRACIYAIRALQEHATAKTTWRMSVPGDGFKY